MIMKTYGVLYHPEYSGYIVHRLDVGIFSVKVSKAYMNRSHAESHKKNLESGMKECK